MGLKVVEKLKTRLEVDKTSIVEAITHPSIREIYCIVVADDGVPYMISTHEGERDLAFAAKAFDNCAVNAINELSEDELG